METYPFRLVSTSPHVNSLNPLHIRLVNCLFLLLLQVCKQIRTTIGSDLAEEEFTLKQAMGILQHHDAISGTEKQHVADDYALYLAEGVAACEKVVNAAYR